MQKRQTLVHKKTFIKKNKPFEDGQIVAMNEYGDGEIHGYHKVIKVARAVVGDQVRVELPLKRSVSCMANFSSCSSHRINESILTAQRLMKAVGDASGFTSIIPNSCVGKPGFYVKC